MPRSVITRSVLALLLTTGSAALVGCSSTSSLYPDAARSNFVTACVGAGSSQTYCSCTFDWIEKNVSYQDFLKFDAEARAGNTFSTPSWLPQALTACQ